jgi:hypothetical protein
MNDKVINGITVPFSDMICSSILTNAIEGGSAYWANDYTKLHVDRDKELNVTEFRIGNPRRGAECNEPVINHIVTLADIRKAFQWLVDNQGKDGACHPSYVADIIKNCDEFGCGSDAYTCDIVVQVAVFGKVIYG